MNLLQKSLSCFLLCLPAALSADNLPAYLDEEQPLEVRVEDALSRMTLQEKIAIIHAQSKFSSPGVPRLGIPGIWTTDGPHGIRPEVMWDEWDQAKWSNDSCVAFPALTCLAATWDEHLSHLYGKSIGEEARFRDKDVLLGPGVNIYRTPLNGRNFEYMGEDPYLASRMVVPYVKGVQENGVAVCVKHYALNNQETRRHTTNVILSDRALYEIYLPPFYAALTEGDAWSVMGAYDLYQNQHACHNKRLLIDILRNEWDWKGAVISDWGGCHSTEEAIVNGLDLEFGSWTDGLKGGSLNAYDNYYMAYPYLKLIKEGKYTTKELDDKVRHVLRLTMLTAMNRRKPFGSFHSPEHYAAARQIGAEGTVLLKNDGNVLPLRCDGKQKVLVVGENAVKMMTVGGGSSSLKAQHEISPLKGITDALRNKAEVKWVRGYVGDVTGEYNGVVTGQDLSDNRSPEQLIAEAVEESRNADYVIFIGGLNKSNNQDCEDTDREGLELPYSQDAVIEALAAVNKHLVVVNISGNAVAMPWVKKVPAIVQTWYLGSEAGNAIADVLTGAVNPCGKLPFTFPVSLNDVGAHALNAYPGVERTDGSKIWDVEYKEDIFVGYRRHDSEGIKPLFAFGHGISYTSFDYGKLSLSAPAISADDTLTASITVKNSGSCAGKEVVQLYISDKKSSLPRPVKELKGFKKVSLQPGESTTVTFSISRSALSYFDADRHEWVAEPGEFQVLVGASAADIRSRASFTLK